MFQFLRNLEACKLYTIKRDVGTLNDLEEKSDTSFAYLKGMFKTANKQTYSRRIS